LQRFSGRIANDDELAFTAIPPLGASQTAAASIPQGALAGVERHDTRLPHF